MAFNVPEEEKPKFNKAVKSGLDLFANDVQRTLGQLEVLQPQTLVDAYNQPVQAPVARNLSPLEQYVHEPQPAPEVGSLTEMPARDSMVIPQEQPQVLSNFRNQAEAQFSRDMVSITPYEQAVTDVIGADVDSLRNDAGEIAKSPLEVFSKPLNANSVRALGLVDQDGNPTERGQLFYNLQQSGVFNEDGTINEKGQAYLTPIADIGKEENLKAFQILWDDEVIRPNATFGEIASNTGKFVVDAALGGATRIGQEAQSFWYNSQTWDSALGRTDLRPQELRDKMTASGLGLVEGAVENLAGWAGIADIGSAWIGKKLYDVLPDGMEDEAEQALYAARQRQWQTQQNIVNLSTGEIAEVVLGMDNAVAEAESAKSRIGKEEFDKQYGQTSAFSQIALDPTNAIPASIAVKAARTAPLANRVAITAQKRMASIAAKDLAIAEAQTAIEAANAVLKKEAATVSVANRLALDISTRAGASPELVARANQASQVASRISDSANQIRTTLPTITAELESLVAKRNSLATRIPEAYSQKVLQTMELGRQMRSMPAKAVGATLERVGDTISKTDTAVTNFLQERGLDQMYTAAVGAAGVVGLAGNPIIGALGAGAAALKTGKVLSNYGKLFRYVGKEMENVRAQMPFWKRVARHTAPGSLSRGFAHTFNMLDLGGVTSDTIRRAGRGIAAAAPTDLMFEYLSDGADMRPETLYQAGSESFFIGGSFAAGGGAFMGTKKRMRELSIGDEINFRRDLIDPRQKALFEAIPAGTRRAISTYAIANPTLNYTFKDSGASRYDPNTNTAVINVNSTNPIKALVAHETLHHTVIKNNMEPGISALFLGDTKNNTVGGLFRSRDGKLDPNFEAFRDGYYKRLGVEGMSNAERDAIYPLDKIAVEYFIEKHADQYAAMAESGELGAVAASGAARRKLGSILETVLPRIPVLKDLHFKSGGMIDKNGAWVTGNGILDAEGVKRDPITSKMFRDMNRRSAGLVPGQFDPLMSDKPDSGAPILLNPADGIDAELLHPLVQVDDANKPILKDGKPVALDRATELSRALAGLTAKEVLQRKRSENYAPEKGEAYVDDEGQFQPGWLSNDVLTEMFAKNNYNPEQKRIIREMNKLIRKGAGDRVVMINFPATTRNKAGKVVYKPQGATLRDTVPVAVTISKDGNLLFGLMSVTKLHENIQKRSQDRRGKKLYGGNVDLILRDTQAMMDYHKQGVDSIEFFKQKYGAVEADERKKFINTMFGLLNQKEQAVLNPILLEDGVKSRDNVYRTYRADRVSKAVPMSPDEYPAMPFSYEAVSAVRMPEQRQMPEVSPENLNQVANKQEAQGLWADGKRMFALNEMDEKLTPITSKAMLDSYSADAIGWMEPEQAPAPSQRFMPEGDQKPQQAKQWNPNPIVATNKAARAKGIPERITDELFELIKNKPIVVGMADLLGAGGKIRGVDVSGGPGYPIQNFDPAKPDDITGVWASERGGINTILQNMVKTDSIWQDESGHNWALFAPHTMAQSAHKSNAQTPEIYISKVNDMAISGALKKATASDLSDHIRANVPVAKDMPNIGTEKLTKFIHDAAFETRAAIMSELSNVRSRDLGAPSPETILTESRDPQYHGVEKNALTGLLLIDVDRLATKDENGNWKLRSDLSADDFNIPKHPSYGTVMPGKVLAHFDNPVPFRISTPEMINTMRAASPLSRIDYLLARMPKDKGIKFQPLTDQIKNAINEAQNISGNVPYIREAVKAVNGNWRKFTSGASLKGLAELIGAIHRSPARDSLTQYNLSELQKMIKEDKMEVHQLGDNDIWFGVKKSKDGNELVSVVNNTGIPGMLNLIMQRALEVGVNKLDAYAVPTSKTPNGLLPSLYKRYGWKEVERMPFDRQYLIERKKGEKKADHEEKIAQKEAALKMFWTEQGWDGQSNPDVVFMTYEKGRKTEITSGQSEGSLVKQRIAESGAASEATSGEVRGAGLVGGREQATVGGPTQGDSGTGEGVLPRGFDSIVQSLRSASPVQIETIGITDAERKQFLKKLGVQ